MRFSQKGKYIEHLTVPVKETSATTVSTILLSSHSVLLPAGRGLPQAKYENITYKQAQLTTLLRLGVFLGPCVPWSNMPGAKKCSINIRKYCFTSE